MIYILEDGKDILISSIHPDDADWESHHIRLTDSFTCRMKDENRVGGSTLAGIVRNALTASGEHKVSLL